jgi:hypothetical protein
VTDYRYEKDTCCFHCGLPGDWCEGYSSGVECRNADVMIGTCIAVHESENDEMFGIVREVAGRGFRLDSLAKWLSGKATVLGKSCTNCFSLFVAILQRRKEMDENEMY